MFFFNPEVWYSPFLKQFPFHKIFFPLSELNLQIFPHIFQASNYYATNIPYDMNGISSILANYDDFHDNRNLNIVF